MITYPNISELSYKKRCHLAWRIDRKTGTGYITACRIARLEGDDMPVNKVFEKCGMSPHQAKIHARKVINFTT